MDSSIAFCIFADCLLYSASLISPKESQLGELVRLGMQKTSNPTARLASLDGLRETLIPAYLTPVPSRETLRDWFDAARIPRFKANPAAKRGGGPVFYSLAAVEKFLQARTLPCRLPAATLPSRNPTADPSLN